MNDKPQENDWNVFRDLVPELRERFLRGRNEELGGILRDDSRTPTERFREVEAKTKEIARILRDCLDGFSRSKMVLSMIVMRGHGMLKDEDLAGFSEEVRERVMRHPFD